MSGERFRQFDRRATAALDVAAVEDWQRRTAGGARKGDGPGGAVGRPENERCARGLIEAVVLPVVFRRRRGVRAGFTAFIILVRRVDPAAFGSLGEAELAKGLGLTLREFRRASAELAGVAEAAREGVDVLKAVLEAVLPPLHHCGGVKRWRAAFRSVIFMLYTVAPEAFQGMTKVELAKVLGMRRQGANEGTARAADWLDRRRRADS